LSDGTSYYVYGLGNTPIAEVNFTTGEIDELATDAMGDVRAVLAMNLSDSGELVNYVSYNADGTPSSAGGLTVTHSSYTGTTKFGFGGGYTDDTALVYLIHRYYDTVTGQFLSVDPLENMTQAGYSYAADNPLDGTDPSGMMYGNGGGYYGGADNNPGPIAQPGGGVVPLSVAQTQSSVSTTGTTLRGGGYQEAEAAALSGYDAEIADSATAVQQEDTELAQEASLATTHVQCTGGARFATASCTRVTDYPIGGGGSPFSWAASELTHHWRGIVQVATVVVAGVATAGCVSFAPVCALALPEIGALTSDALYAESGGPHTAEGYSLAFAEGGFAGTVALFCVALCEIGGSLVVGGAVVNGLVGAGQGVVTNSDYSVKGYSTAIASGFAQGAIPWNDVFDVTH
jgi:RHS repeat-associated protein